jgi:hypothetical protein
LNRPLEQTLKGEKPMTHTTPSLEQIIREAKTSKTAKVYQAIGEQGNQFLTQVMKLPGHKGLFAIHYRPGKNQSTAHQFNSDTQQWFMDCLGRYVTAAAN